MSALTVVTLLVVCFLSLELESVEAAHISLQTQFQTALQRVAELKGNGTLKDCCNVSPNLR